MPRGAVVTALSVRGSLIANIVGTTSGKAPEQYIYPSGKAGTRHHQRKYNHNQRTEQQQTYSDQPLEPAATEVGGAETCAAEQPRIKPDFPPGTWREFRCQAVRRREIIAVPQELVAGVGMIRSSLG